MFRCETSAIGPRLAPVLGCSMIRNALTGSVVRHRGTVVSRSSDVLCFRCGRCGCRRYPRRGMFRSISTTRRGTSPRVEDINRKPLRHNALRHRLQPLIDAQTGIVVWMFGRRFGRPCDGFGIPAGLRVQLSLIRGDALSGCAASFASSASSIETAYSQRFS